MTQPRLARQTEHGRMYARSESGQPEVPSITTVLSCAALDLGGWHGWSAAQAVITDDRLPQSIGSAPKLRQIARDAAGAAERHRDEAALAALLHLIPQLDPRVDEDPGVLADLVDEDLQAHADLRGGQAHSLHIAHGLEHVGHQCAQIIVEAPDRVGGGAQDRIPDRADRLVQVRER